MRENNHNVERFKRPKRKRKSGVRHGLPFKRTAWVAVLICLVMVFALLTRTPVVETITTSSGNSRVIDADTLEVAGVRVRIQTISAPERGHPDFEAGRVFVGRLLRASDTVECHLIERTSYDRRIGRCWLIGPEGAVNIQREIVLAGHAKPLMQFGSWAYWVLPFSGEWAASPAPSE